MARYIDADALRKKVLFWADTENLKEHNHEQAKAYNHCLLLIDEAPTATLPIKDKCAFCPHCTNCDVNDDLTIKPTADVVERKMGEWIFNPTDAIEMMFTKPKCSECGFESADGGNYCFNCGADMRGNNDL